MTPLTIALIDEHEIVHHGVAAMLRNAPYGIRLVDRSVVSSRPVDIALYEPMAPGADRRCRRLLLDPSVSRVVAYTWNFQPWVAEGLLRQGLAGYVAKAALAADLVRALRAAHVGQQVLIPPAGARRTKGWSGADAGLTPREAEVLALITAGLSNQAICERLVVSPNSVKSYIRSCYRKIGVESRTQAVLWGLTAGLSSGVAPEPAVTAP